MRTWIRRGRSERGQSTAMVVVMLWVLMLFVALVANVGQAVNRRVALQIVADAGAYSGASKMAEGMNYIAYANGAIQDYYGVATWAWLVNTAALSTCGGFDGINGAYTGLYWAMNVPILALNFGYGGWMHPGGQIWQEAHRNSVFNAKDLFPSREEYENFEYSEWDLSPEVGIRPGHRDALFMVDIDEVDSYSDSPNTKYEAIPPLGTTGHQSQTQPCVTSCPPCVMVKTWDFPLWYEKTDDDPQYMVWIVTAPPVKSMMFNNFFGGIPQMKAVAVARAVGGDIKEGQRKYVAEMVPVSRVQVVPGMIMDQSSPWGPTRRVTH